MINYVVLGERIKKYRKKQGLTQAKLAEAIGVSSNHISKIETASTTPSLEVFVGISDALKVSADQLLLRDTAEFSSNSGEELYELFNGHTAEAKMLIIDILENINSLLLSNQSTNSKK